MQMIPRFPRTSPSGSLLTADGIVQMFYVSMQNDMGLVKHRFDSITFGVTEWNIDGSECDRLIRGISFLQHCRFFATRHDAERARFDRVFRDGGRQMVGAANGEASAE